MTDTINLHHCFDAYRWPVDYPIDLSKKPDKETRTFFAALLDYLRQAEPYAAFHIDEEKPVPNRLDVPPLDPDIKKLICDILQDALRPERSQYFHFSRRHKWDQQLEMDFDAAGFIPRLSRPELFQLKSGAKDGILDFAALNVILSDGKYDVPFAYPMLVVTRTSDRHYQIFMTRYEVFGQIINAGCMIREHLDTIPRDLPLSPFAPERKMKHDGLVQLIHHFDL